MNKTAIITGVTGQDGSYLSDLLIEKGYTVVGTYRRSVSDFANKTQNITFTNKFYVTENPLFLGEYQQAFKNSQLITDFGFTDFKW